MLRPRHLVATLVASGAVVAGFVAPAVATRSSSPTYVRPPLLCAANGMAVSGSALWVSGCVFKGRSAFSTRIPAIVELAASSGSLLRVFKDRDCGNDGPDGIAVSDSRVWVANGDGDSVVELDAKTGSLVRVIRAHDDRFDSPWTIAADASHVWVFNAGNYTITELDAKTGSLVRVITAKVDELTGVNGISDVAGHIWLTNGTYAANAVIELGARNGSLVRVINARADGFHSPSGLAVSGSKLWVTSSVGPVATTPQADGEPNLPGGSVTELNASNAHLIRVINAKKDDFSGSAGIGEGRGEIWVANSLGGTVTEVSASDGKLVRVISAKGDRLGDPSEVVVRGSHVWVLDSAVSLTAGVWGGAVTELNTTNGSLDRVFR